MYWTYKGATLTDDMIPEKAEGFVYLMVDNETGKKYIGRKLLTKAHTRQKNGKKIKSRIESDWRDYWSSSPDVKLLVEEKGKENFTREILVFAATKGQLNYLEEKFLYSVGALESDEWLNSNIRSKMYKRNILGKFNVNDIDTLINYCKGNS